MEASRLADLHAYVDDCLQPDERLVFEKQMAQDPALARRATLWRAQNSAIRAAFDGEGARAFSISIVRHQNEILGKGRRSATVGGKPSYDQLPRPTSPTIAGASRFSAKVAAPNPFRPSLLWRLGLAALSVCLACVWAPAATVVPAKALGEAGVAAFRAFARPGVEPVEFATGDQTEITSVVDDAAHASRLYPGDSFRRQAGGSADRSLSRRLGGFSHLQIASRISRAIDPVS